MTIMFFVILTFIVIERKKVLQQFSFLMKVLQPFKINENGIEISAGTEINHIHPDNNCNNIQNFQTPK